MMPRARVRRTWGWVEACGVAMATGARGDVLLLLDEGRLDGASAQRAAALFWAAAACERHLPAAGAAVGAETMHLYRVKLVWTLEQLRAGSSCGQQRKSQ